MTRRMWAVSSQLSALAMVLSQSLASLRQRPSQANVRSIPQRRGRTSKPLAVSERLTICMVQRPILSSARQLRPGIGGIGEHMAQPRIAGADGLQQRGRAVTVLDVGAVNGEADRKARGVREDMTLAARDRLPGVIAANAAALGGFHALAIDHPGRRAGASRPSSSRAALTR